MEVRTDNLQDGDDGDQEADGTSWVWSVVGLLIVSALLVFLAGIVGNYLGIVVGLSSE